MNGYEVLKRILEIDCEMTNLANKVSKCNNISEKEVILNKIDSLDVEFVKLKHALQGVNVIVK